MCDFANIAGSADIFTNEELGSVSGIFKDIGGFVAAKDEAAQYKKQAGQILQSAKQDIELTAIQQARDLGTRKARYGASGVALKGSAKTLLEEQAKMDELALLTKKYNAELQIGDSLKGMRKAGTEAQTVLSTGLAKAIDFGKNYDFDKITKGFGLGSL